MKKSLKNSLIISTFLFGMALAGCDKTPAKTVDTLYEEIKSLSAETDEGVISELSVVNSDAIYGNIYLPSSVDGKDVTWWSSNKNIINPEKSGTVKPGEVNRQRDKRIRKIGKIKRKGPRQI